MSNLAEKHEELLSPREFNKKRPEIGLGSVYDALRNGKIRHIRIGRKYLIPASEVDGWPARESGRI